MRSKKYFFKLILILILNCACCAFAECNLYKEYKRGAALKPGACIGIIAPASYADDTDFQGSIELLRSHGYKIKLAPSSQAVYDGLGGTDRKRAEDLNNFFSDKSVDAILCVRGGYGSARILDRLNYDLIAKNPKPLIGFSDITALHIALHEKSGLATIHAPMLVSFVSPKFDSEYTRESFFNGLKSTEPINNILMPDGKKLESLIAGEAEGVIIGGNLTVLTSLVGTPYELNGKGALLFLEDTGEKPYRIDRMFNQLWQSGLLKRVNGIILGDFVNCDSNNEDAKLYGFTLENVIKHYARLAGKPVIKGVPAGHAKDNMFLPFGVHAIMRANDDGTAELVIDEAALIEKK